MYYIQRRGNHLETVDEFEKYEEALAMVKEYRSSDSSVNYYISKRCCKDWKKLESK